MSKTATFVGSIQMPYVYITLKKNLSQSALLRNKGDSKQETPKIQVFYTPVCTTASTKHHNMALTGTV